MKINPSEFHCPSKGRSGKLPLFARPLPEAYLHAEIMSSAANFTFQDFVLSFSLAVLSSVLASLAGKLVLMSARFPVCEWGARLTTAPMSALRFPASWPATPFAFPSVMCCAWALEPTEYGRSDGKSLLRLDYKRCCSFHFGLTYSLLGHLLWGKASCSVLRTLPKCCVEASVVRNWYLQTTPI